MIKKMFLELNRFPAIILFLLHFTSFCQAYSVEKGSKIDCDYDCERRYDGYEDYGNAKFIDLTHAFNNNTARWPGRKITFYTEWERRDSNGIWSASYGWCTSEHSSTHMDAPYHFNEFGRRLNEIPWEDLIDVPGVCIDISDKVREFKYGKLIVNENYTLTVEDILEWEAKNGLIPQKAVVLLRTGWDALWSFPRLFRGERMNDTTDANATSGGNTILGDKLSEDFNENVNSGSAELKPQTDNSQFFDPSESWLSATLRFPGYGAEAAKFLAEERSVRGAGADTISVDPGNQNVLNPAHQIFAGRNIYMLEMVANLHALPPRCFKLWLVPFKIDRGTAAPTRVIAKLCEEY